MRRHLPLLVVLTFALGLRLFHLGWGLPEVYEEATPYRKAFAFWNWGKPGLDLHPRFFNYPALTFYVQFGVQAAHYGAGRLAGTTASPEEFRAASEKDPTTGILLARLCNALLDLGTIALAFSLARRLAGMPAAVTAGVLTAAAPLHVQQAQMVNVDVTLTLFAMLVLYLLVRLQETGTLRWYLLAGAAIGLAASAKYTGALLGVPLVAAAAAREGRGVLRPGVLLRICAAGAIAAGLFLLLNPYILLDRAGFLADFAFEQRHMEAGHFGIEPGSSTAAFYLLRILPAALGILPAAFVSLGLLTTPRKELARRVPLIVWPILYLAVVFSWTMRADRYLLPVIPVAAVWASFGMVWLWNRMIPASASRAVRAVSAVVLGLVLLGEPVSANLRYYRAAALPDTRDITREWIERTLPPGAVAAMGPLGLTLRPPLVTFPIPYRSVVFEEFAPFYDARWYEDMDLAVGSTFDLARFRQEPGRFRDFLRFYYDSLETRWSMVFEIEPARGQRGPAIRLYAPAGPPPAVYDTVLLGRLREIGASGMLRAFLNNLLAVQTARGNERKVEQLLEWQAQEYARRGLWKEAVLAADEVLKRRPGDTRLRALRDAAAARLP